MISVLDRGNLSSKDTGLMGLRSSTEGTKVESVADERCIDDRRSVDWICLYAGEGGKMAVEPGVCTRFWMRVTVTEITEEQDGRGEN